MWIVLLLLAVIIQPDTANGNTLSCRPPWIKLRRACYKFVKAKETWINAKMHCNSEGGDLVSIVTFSEKRRILRRLMSEITSPDHQYWWVGLGLIRSRGQWVWQDGTPLDIRIVNWMPGEPNNVRNDHCAEMSYKAMLNDRHCSDRRPFICERVPITPPPSKSTTPIPVTTTTTVTTVATTTTTELPTTTTSQKSTDQPTTIRAIETTEKETTIGDVTVSSKDKEKSLTDITTLNDVPTNKISTSSMTDKTTVVMFHHSSSAKMSSTVSRSHVTTVLPHRRTNHCPSVMAYDILWLKASKGETVSRPCKNGNGYAIWVCGTDPVEWLGEPDLSKCASETFAELVASVNKLTQERKVVSPEVAAEIATKLMEKTKVVKQDISSADIAVSTDILKKASKAKPENKEQASKLIKTFASAGSNIMKQAKSSPVIMKEDKRRSASRLLETIENAIQSVVESIEEPAVIQRKEEKLSLTVQVVNASLSSKITYDDTESENEFSIPILRDFSKDGLAKVVFVTYYDIGDMLPVGEATSGAGTLQGGDKSAGKTELKVASNVISASIGLQETVKLPEPVNFTIRLKIKRITSARGLFRRKDTSDIVDVGIFISNELKNSGALHGYRWMHAKCKDRGFTVDQETVRLIMKCFDPEGVKLRSKRRLRRRAYINRGPNFLWHIDGYDKLKPYGICIHGCVDGFSRRIIWLEAAASNNNPKLIAGYFMEAISRIRGCPRTVRADLGTENCIVRQLQIFLRDCDDDANRAFLYGTSRCNQRIESWWGILRKECAQFWMDTFETFKDDGYFTGDHLDQELIRFCFLDLIQGELDIVGDTWNGHRIRRTKNQRTPNGRPFMLYNMPEMFGAEDYLCEAESIKINLCVEECLPKPNTPCDPDLYSLCHLEMQQRGWNEPTTVQEAIELYTSLNPVIKHLLN